MPSRNSEIVTPVVVPSTTPSDAIQANVPSAATLITFSTCPSNGENEAEATTAPPEAIAAESAYSVANSVRIVGTEAVPVASTDIVAIHPAASKPMPIAK